MFILSTEYCILRSKSPVKLQYDSSCCSQVILQPDWKRIERGLLKERVLFLELIWAMSMYSNVCSGLVDTARQLHHCLTCGFIGVILPILPSMCTIAVEFDRTPHPPESIRKHYIVLSRAADHSSFMWDWNLACLNRKLPSFEMLSASLHELEHWVWVVLQCFCFRMFG